MAMALPTSQTPIRIQDLRTLFRAREIIERLAVRGVESAIETVRAILVDEKSRQRYVQEMLPAHVAHRVPGVQDTFVVECADGQRFELHGGVVPLLWQIATLEQVHGTEAIGIVHHNGHGQQEYWL
jgi:hypothetical protein